MSSLRASLWLIRMLLGWLLATSSSSCGRVQALTSSIRTTENSPVVVSQQQKALLDGGEWSTLQAWLQQEGHLDKQKATKLGTVTVATGTLVSDPKQPVVGMLLDDNHFCTESVANLPPKLSEQDAIATYLAALTTIHPVLPTLQGVGGSNDRVLGGKVVILGSNELACFAAQGLTALGVHVCLVSTGNPKVKMISSKKNGGTLEIVKPSVGSDGVGFSSHVGQFDAMLDTLHNERPVQLSWAEEGGDSTMMTGSTVLSLLRSKHNCQRYISTLTECQAAVAREGIFGGPGRADDYAKTVAKANSGVGSSSQCRPVPSWPHLGGTMQMLLDKDVVFSHAQRQKQCAKQSNLMLRGWSLADFMEQTTWPRDSSGTGGTRFGLPVVDDEEDEDENVSKRMVLEAPSRGVTRRKYESFKEDLDVFIPPPPDQDNPFVYQVAGIHGVETEIMKPGLDAILFMSAQFCKTCKALQPSYTRMARIMKEENGGKITFAKAETSGRFGKQLGKYFEVEAVPAFILFRNGKIYGTPLSVSKLPSEKISSALELLGSGAEWDSSILELD